MAKYFWFLFLTFCSPLAAIAQLTISGVTRDSITLKPLPFVSIVTANKNYVTSDNEGRFSITCHLGDTSVFTHLGYKKKIQIHFKSEVGLSVTLSEFAYLLETASVIDEFKPQGKEQWKTGKYQLQPFEERVNTEPGGVAYFGAGGSISGLLSRFSKYEKDKKKLAHEKQDVVATQTYRDVLSSEQVKQDLMKLFSLTEAEYYKKIEAFNIRYPDIAYVKSRDEIINLLTGFFALKEK